MKTHPFKKIPGLPGYYATDTGEIWSSWIWGSSRPVKRTRDRSKWYRRLPYKNSHGYMAVGITRRQRRIVYSVHVLVARAFLGPRPTGLQTCHRNGERTDNRIANLRYGTPAENSQDRICHGRSGVGEASPRAKLIAQDVRTIRKLCHTGLSFSAIGSRYGVTKQNIYRIMKGLSWRHVLGLAIFLSVSTLSTLAVKRQPALPPAINRSGVVRNSSEPVGIAWTGDAVAQQGLTLPGWLLPVKGQKGTRHHVRER